uniref:Uncharacterized protein n=1 Tax=Parastrongyloides trichosuri TaxID=131310 RepID=A0A0N4ZRY8_PARTI
MWKSDDFLLIMYGLRTILSTIMENFIETAYLQGDSNNFDVEGQIAPNNTSINRRYFDKENNRRIQGWI